MREVRVGTPAERLGQARWFYRDVLGLSVWPTPQQLPGSLGLGNPQCGLLLQLRHDPAVDSARRRLTVSVHSLAELMHRLDEADWPYELLRGLGWASGTLLVRDPAGHLIEVRESLPL